MRTALGLLAPFCLLAPAAALAEPAFTTRVEPRPYYGATVTIEAGVRVFRPLPPHRQIVINPGHSTSLNLGYSDVRERNYNYNYEAPRHRNGYSSEPEGGRPY
jgi:hypothetical protein